MWLLKDNSFTKNHLSFMNSSGENLMIYFIFLSKQIWTTGLMRTAFWNFHYTVLTMLFRSGKVFVILVNCQCDSGTLSNFDKARSPIFMFLTWLFLLCLMVRSGRYSLIHCFKIFVKQLALFSIFYTCLCFNQWFSLMKGYYIRW